MSLYELTDIQVNNARVLISKSPITFEQANAVNDILMALSKPIDSKTKDDKS